MSGQEKKTFLGTEPLDYVRYYYCSNLGTIKCNVRQFIETILGTNPTEEDAKARKNAFKEKGKKNKFTLEFSRNNVPSKATCYFIFYMILPNGTYVRVPLSIRHIYVGSRNITVSYINSSFSDILNVATNDNGPGENMNAYLFRDTGTRVNDMRTLTYGGNFLIFFHFQPANETMRALADANDNDDITQYIVDVGMRDIPNRELVRKYKADRQRKMDELYGRLESGLINQKQFYDTMTVLQEEEIFEDNVETEYVTKEEIAQSMVDNVNTNNNNLMDATPPDEELKSGLSLEEQIYEENKERILTDFEIPNSSPPSQMDMIENRLNEAYIEVYNSVANSVSNINQIGDNGNLIPRFAGELAGGLFPFADINGPDYEALLNRLANDRFRELVGREILREAEEAEIRQQMNIVDQVLARGAQGVGYVAKMVYAYNYARRNYAYILTGAFTGILSIYGVHLLFAYDNSYAQKTIDFIYNFVNAEPYHRDYYTPGMLRDEDINKPIIAKDLERMFEDYKKVIPESAYILPESVNGKTPLPIQESNQLSGVSISPKLTLNIGSVYENTSLINQPLIGQAIMKSLRSVNPSLPDAIGPTQLDHLLGPIITESVRYVSETIVPPIFSNQISSPSVSQIPIPTPYPVSTLRPIPTSIPTSITSVSQIAIPTSYPISTLRSIPSPSVSQIAIPTQISAPTPNIMPTQPVFNTIVVNTPYPRSIPSPAPWKVNYNIGGYKPEYTSLSLSPTPTPSPSPGSETIVQPQCPVPSKKFVDYIKKGLAAMAALFVASGEVGVNLVKEGAKKGLGYIWDTTWSALGSVTDVAIKGVQKGAELIILGVAALIGYLLIKR